MLGVVDKAVHGRATGYLAKRDVRTALKVCVGGQGGEGVCVWGGWGYIHVYWRGFCVCFRGGGGGRDRSSLPHATSTTTTTTSHSHVHTHASPFSPPLPPPLPSPPPSPPPPLSKGFFSSKRPGRLEEVLEALDTDCPGETVQYRRLFDDDGDLNQVGAGGVGGGGVVVGGEGGRAGCNQVCVCGGGGLGGGGLVGEGGRLREGFGG